MPETVRLRDWPARVAAGSALFIAMLGLLVLAGWFTHTTALIQLQPNLPPMTRNAAACFGLCGVALLTVICKGPRWLTYLCAGIVSGASVITIAEYLFRFNAGIDEILGTSYLLLKVSCPGRMAPVTATCFILASLGLLLAAKATSKRIALWLGLDGSIIAAAGIATSMNFALGSSNAIGWNEGTHVAIHTAVGLLVLGIGISALAWHLTKEQAETPRWLPFSVAIGVATCAFGLWQALVADGSAPFELVPAVVLVGGCLIAPIFGLTIYQAQRAHTQAKKLQANRDLLDLAQKAARAMAFDWYINEPINTWSPEQEALYGLAPGTFDGTFQSWKKLVHAADWPLVVKALKHAQETGDISVEYRAVWPDGSIHWLAAGGQMFFDDHGRPYRMVGFTVDVTRRKLVEEELRRSAAFLAEAQRLSSIGSFSWLVARDEVVGSEQLYRIFDVDPSVPVTFELLRTRVHFEDQATFNERVARARSNGGDMEFEFRLQLPDHSVKFMHLVARCGRDENGQMEYIGVVQDVTERRRSEEALSKVQAELAHVARVTSLGALTASIAHEVNQPLSGIITNASTCLRMLDADPPNVDGARETARRTIRDGHRASDVITRLRALFSKRDTTTEPVDLNEATREVLALASSELQRSRVILRAELGSELAPVTGDRVQLQQVILNLLRNASDAMSTVEDRPRQLTIRTERDGDDRVRLSVQDAGTGFGPESMNKLFEAFYSTKSDGMGMGLSVSRSIIENHHGRLWAQANDGPGATFLFSIPCGAKEDGPPL